MKLVVIAVAASVAASIACANPTDLHLQPRGTELEALAEAAERVRQSIKEGVESEAAGRTASLDAQASTSGRRASQSRRQNADLPVASLRPLAYQRNRKLGRPIRVESPASAYNRATQAAWRSRTLRATPWKLWEKGRYWSQVNLLRRARGTRTLTGEDVDYLKREAKLHTEDRIAELLGHDKAHLYTSVAEREEEREVLRGMDLERMRLPAHARSSVVSSEPVNAHDRTAPEPSQDSLVNAAPHPPAQPQTIEQVLQSIFGDSP